MSENIPLRHAPKKKPDVKIRPGFSDGQLAEFHSFLSKISLEDEQNESSEDCDDGECNE